MDKNSIVSVEEMKILDHLTCESKGFTSYDLMNHVGKTIYEDLIISDINIDDEILIVSGYGNNGGDGIIVGKNFLQNGYNVSFALIGSEKGATFETKLAISDLENLKTKFLKVSNVEDFNKYIVLLSKSTKVVDAIFGIGLSRDIEGIYYDVIKEMNNSKKPIFSIDIPSGISAENGLVKGIAVKAKKTIVIQHYKYGNLLQDASNYHGNIVVLDVGINYPEIDNNIKLLDKSDSINKISKRINNTNKYHYGSVLTVGGSKGMMGAPVLAAYAALKTGSGLSSIAVHEMDVQYRINNYPELMECFYQDITSFKDCLSKKNIVVFGPGLGRNNELNEILLTFLLQLKTPMVIDADGLFYFKKFLKNNNYYPNVVITPHLGELAKLTGKEINDIINNPFKDIMELSNTFGITIVLKGYCTFICNKHVAYISRFGNPGMATAGSGDVLSGIIGSLIGQGYSIIEASKLGVLLHSFAGEKAREKFGEDFMSSINIIDGLSEALKLMKVK